MFSRYKKSDAKQAQPVEAAPKTAAPAPEKAKAAPPKAAVKRREAPSRPAQAAPADKALRRKERISDIKVEMHKRLLEDLNLSALESAPEKELRAEISNITSEFLSETGMVLNRDEKVALNQDLYDEVKGLGPLEALLQDESVNDILVNGPQQIFVERAGKLELSDITFKNEKHLLRIIDKIVSAVARRARRAERS